MTKYNSTKVEFDGIVFDSRDEKLYYEHLKKLVSEQMILKFELQPTFELIPKYEKLGKKIRSMTYTPDFKVYHNDGEVELIDIKGFSTQQGDIRKKLFNYRYPELKLTWLTRSIKFGGWVEYDELKKMRKDSKAEKFSKDMAIEAGIMKGNK